MSSSSLSVSLCLCLLLLLAFPVSSASSVELKDTLMDHYDDGSEMNQRIITEFLESEQCQKECVQFTPNRLLNEFEAYRTAWVKKMVNFVIAELGLDAESAKYVRKNPANYMINYETFKILSFK